MKKPVGLGISLALVNGMDDNEDEDGGIFPHDPCDDVRTRYDLGLSPMGTTYRAEGLSIGRDYMRFEGMTLSSQLSRDDLVVEGTIGRGACSIVKKARLVLGERSKIDIPEAREERGEREETDPPTLMALKMFPIRRDRKRREMLVKELKALCSLECDCLVTLTGAFFDDEEGTVTLVLEYMDRGSLGGIIGNDSMTNPSTANHHQLPLHIAHNKGNNGLPERAVASIAYQMLWGLGYLHHENMIHRDVKPGNVLVNSKGEVKLSDFGIASQREDGQEMNVTVIGTTRYMSPERLRAKPYGSSSDIWSLGLVLLECATGKSPFEDVTSMVELLLTVEESTADEWIPKDSISPGLVEILKCCLQQSPERRMPASVLIGSPWFEKMGIESLDDAVHVMRQYITDDFPRST